MSADSTEEPAKSEEVKQEAEPKQEPPEEFSAESAGASESKSKKAETSHAETDNAETSEARNGNAETGNGNSDAKKDDEEDSDDAWGDWTKKGKEEEEEDKEDDEEDGWGDWTKKGVKDGKSSKKKEKTVNPFTLLLQKGKGKGDDNGRNYGRRERGGRRDFRGRDGKGRSLAAQARAEALARERSVLDRARAMLHRHVNVVPAKVRPPQPPFPLNLPPRPFGPPGPIPVRPGMVAARPPMFVMPKLGHHAIPMPGGHPGAWIHQVPAPPLPFRPAIPPRPMTAPSSRAAPSTADSESQQPKTPPTPPTLMRPRQKARPSPRPPAPSVARPTVRPTSRKPSRAPGKPPEPAEPPKSARAPAAAPATNGVKRPRDEGFAEKLSTWLNGLDRGGGVMLSYLEVLSESFGSWEDMVEGAVQDCDSKKMIFKKCFLDAIELKKPGHKIMFANGFRKLVNELKAKESAAAERSAQGRVPEPTVQAAPHSQAPQTPPRRPPNWRHTVKPTTQRPQPKRRPLPPEPIPMPEETAQLEPVAEDDEMEDVACDPVADPEDATVDRLWQDWVPSQSNAEEAPPEVTEAWTEEALDEAPLDMWAASLGKEAAEGSYLHELQHGSYEEDETEEVLEEVVPEEEEEEVEIPDKVEVPVPAPTVSARSRPFSAFGSTPSQPKVVRPRVAVAAAVPSAPRAPSVPSARTAKPPATPPPARLLQGRHPPPEPVGSPRPKATKEKESPSQKIRAIAEVRKRARLQQ